MNPFDQFDQPAAPVAGNPFDQFDQAPPAVDDSILGKLKQAGKDAYGGLESVVSMAAGLPSYILSGYSGLGNVLAGHDAEESANAVANTQDWNFGVGALHPRTDSGKDAEAMIGTGAGIVRDVGGDVGGTAGKYLSVFNTGNYSNADKAEAAGRSLGEFGADVAMNFAPLPGGKAVRVLGHKIEGKLTPKEALKPIDPIRPVSEVGNVFDRFDTPPKEVMDRVQAQEAALPQEEVPATTRLYHGSAEHGRYDGDAWFSTNKDYAKNYRENAELQYVDYPTDKLNARMDPDGYGQTADKGFTGNFELHSDETGLRKPFVEDTPAPQGISVPQSQRGGINIQEVADGFKAFVDGKEVGYLKDNLPRGMAERLGENANVDIVKVDPQYRGSGIGKELYAAFNEKHGGNIAPSGKTSPSAWKLWQRDYPSKVDNFVSQEAARIRDGAPTEQVLGNITEPTIRRRVIEEANPLKALNEPMRVPRGQAGGISRDAINAVGDAVKKMQDMVSPPKFKGVDIPKAPIRTGTEAVNIPGMKKTARDWLNKDQLPSDVKAAILKEGAENGSLKAAWLRDGANQTAMGRKSAFIRAAYNWVDNANKAANLNIRQYVEPVESFINRFKGESQVKLARVLKDEMFHGMKYTDEQFAKLGLTSQEITAYKALRDMQAETLKRQNEALKDLGRKEITPKDAYLTSMWQGRHRMPIYDPKGRLIYYLADHSKSSLDKQFNKLLDSGVAIDKEKSQKEYWLQGAMQEHYRNSRGKMEDSYLNLLSILDPSDPRTQVLREIAEKGYDDNAYSTLGQPKHFEPKNNVRGFVGDRPGFNQVAEAQALFRAQMSQAKNAFKWAESQKAASHVKELLADPDVQKLQPTNAEYVRQYLKGHLGYGEWKLVTDIENAVGEMMGHIPGLNRLSGKGSEINNIAKTFFIVKALGANTGFTIMNLLQSFNSIPYHGEMSSSGIKHNVLKTIARSNMDWAAGMANHASDSLASLADKKSILNLKMTDLGRDAWAYMDAHGMSKRNVMEEGGNIGQNKILGAGKTIGGLNAAVTEQLLRTHVMLEMVHHLDQSGKFPDRQELFQKAESLTDGAIGNFGKDEKALIFQKLGLVGSAASTLKKFTINYYNSHARWAAQALKGNPRPLLYALAIQYALGGVLNLPGFQDTNRTWEWIKDHLPNDAFDAVKDVNIKQAVIKNLGDNMSYGLLSNETKMNWANRSDTSLLPSVDPLDGLFPFAGDAIANSAAVAGVARHPTSTTAQAQAMYQFAPNGPLKGMAQSTEPFISGYTDKGETKFVKPSILHKHDFDYARSPEQIDMKKTWGMSSLEETRNKDLTRSVNVDSQRMDNRRKQLVEDGTDALIRGSKEDYSKSLKLFMSFNGDPNDWISGIQNGKMGSKASREKLQAINSSNISVLEKLRKIKELVGEIR